MNAIDLFSGCGGLTMGLKNAGFNVVAAIDNSDVAVKTYTLNHPEVHVWHDTIINLDKKRIKRELGLAKGELDLLAGCPPCQGFSTLTTHNRKQPVKDKRNDLVFEFLRLAEELMPKALMMENVPGLFVDPRLKKVLASLRKAGYRFSDESVSVIDAKNYGVPQRRRRMILMATLCGSSKLALPDTRVYTVRDAIGHLTSPTHTDDPIHANHQNLSERVLARVKAIPKDGGSRTSLPPNLVLKCHQKQSAGFRDVYGRMAWDAPAPTITSGCTNPSKGRFLHPEQNRGITLREASLLQSFPYDYLFDMSRGRAGAALMIGNALPPELIRRQAESLRKVLIQK